MASTKVAFLAIIICFFLQCVDSESIHNKLRVNDLPKGKHGWNLGLKNRQPGYGLKNKIQITADLTDLEGKFVSPSFEFGKLKFKNRKPIFDGKLGKHASLKEKLSKLAKRKSAFLKGKLANVGRIKPSFSQGKLGLKKKFGNKLKFKKLGKIDTGKLSKGFGFDNSKVKSKIDNVFGRRLLVAPKLNLDGKLTNQKLNVTNGMLGSKGVKLNTKLGSAGLFKNSLRQRLAEKLGLGNRFQFFDGRRGIFDRTNGIIDSKRVNPLDMLDGKLANLNARFGKAIDRIHNKFSEKIGRLQFSPVDASLLKERLDKALDKVDLKVGKVDGKLGETLSRVGEKVAGINGKVEDAVGVKMAFVDNKFNHIKKAIDSKIQTEDRKLPLIKSVGAKERSLLGGLKLGRSFGRLGGGLKLRSGLNVRSGLKLGRGKGLRFGSGISVGGGLRLGGGLRFGRSKLSLDRPKLSFRRFRRIGGPKIDSRSAAAIANVIVAGINGVAPSSHSAASYDSYSGDNYRGHSRRLRAEPRETLFQRLSLKNSHKPRLSLSDRLAQKVNLKLGNKVGDRFTLKLKSPKSGRLAALLARKFGSDDTKIAQLPLFNRRFGDKFGRLPSFDGKLGNIEAISKFDGKFKNLSRKSLKSKVFDKSRKFPRFDFKHFSPISTTFSAEAPTAVSTTTVAPTTQATTLPAASSIASADFEVASNEDGSALLSGMGHEDISGVPGTEGVLFAIELLESGGTLEHATEALIHRNDMPALKTLMDAVKQAAMRR